MWLGERETERATGHRPHVVPQVLTQLHGGTPSVRVGLVKGLALNLVGALMRHTDSSSRPGHLPPCAFQMGVGP